MRRSQFKYIAFAFLATLVVYLPSARFELQHFDDRWYVTTNPHMREGLTAENVRWALTNKSHASNWHPLTWLSLQADVTVDRLLRGGAALDEKAWARYDTRAVKIMHVHNVLLHAANAALLAALILMVCGEGLAPVWALVLALLWSLHPLRVEGVCWVTEREEVLSVFWGLVSLMAYFGGRGAGGACSKPRYAISVVAFALALLAKAVVVTIPAVVLAWDWIFGGRVRWRRLTPFVLLALLACFMTMRGQAEAIVRGTALSPFSRFLTFFGAPAVYLKQTVWPFGLSIVYPPLCLIGWPLLVAGGLLVAAMASVVVRWLVRRDRLSGIGAFAVAWVYVGLLPMLGIVKAGVEEHCDRFTYWVGCGASVAVAMLFVWLKSKRESVLKALGDDVVREPWWKLRRYVLGGLTAVGVALGGLSMARMTCWHDAVTLLRADMPKCWDSEMAEALAQDLLERQVPGAEQEGEMWLRECATRLPCYEADLALAAFLLRKPHVARSFGLSDANAFAEEECLVRGVLRDRPDMQRAQRLLKQIEDAKLRLK